MLEEGLFERFPCDSIFGMHNRPCLPIGNCTIRAGPMMADRTSLPRARLERRTLPRKGLFDLDVIQLIRNEL
jgi:hypothetical protein